MAAAASKSSEDLRLLRFVPRALEPRVTQLRRDLRSVIAGLRGERAPAWLPRDGSRYASAPKSEPASVEPVGHGLATRELELVERVRETADAVSLILADPSGAPLGELRPGQFLTLLVELDGETLRRAYSISSDCRAREQVRVTIKRVVDGRVSNYLVDHAEPGLKLRVLGPSGEFGCVPEPGRAPARKLVLIAGGSGITPMMALMLTLLASEDDCEIALIDANRALADVIFADALAELVRDYGPRLSVHHTLEVPPAGWTGHVGRADAATLATILDAPGLALADDPETQFMLCGPTPMMDAARTLLRERGVEPSRIRSESFLSPHAAALDAEVSRVPQPVVYVLGEREQTLELAPGQTVLESGLAAGLALPYSCAMGGCGACKVALENGQVTMREPNCLSTSEREAGFVLACVSSPTSPCRIRVPSPSPSLDGGA